MFFRTAKGIAFIGLGKHVTGPDVRCVSLCPRRLSDQVLSGGLIAAVIFIASNSFAANWQSSVSKDPPGNFPPLRPLRTTYNFGWSGLTAATADVHISRTSDNRCQLEGTGRTTGLARALWRYDVSYRSLTDGNTLRPIETNQNESVRSKKMATHLTFNNTGVARARTEGPGAGTTKTKQFNFQNLFDLGSAMLYLRSQPLKDRSSYRIVVYPNTSAYLATVTVLGHEKVAVRAGSYNAIKADLQLSKLGKNLELEPHRKFRRATVWMSDDADRLILRIEAQVFVGTVFAELQSVRFDAKP